MYSLNYKHIGRCHDDVSNWYCYIAIVENGKLYLLVRAKGTHDDLLKYNEAGESIPILVNTSRIVGGRFRVGKWKDQWTMIIDIVSDHLMAKKSGLCIFNEANAELIMMAIRELIHISEGWLGKAKITRAVLLDCTVEMRCNLGWKQLIEKIEKRRNFIETLQSGSDLIPAVLILSNNAVVKY